MCMCPCMPSFWGLCLPYPVGHSVPVGLQEHSQVCVLLELCSPATKEGAFSGEEERLRWVGMAFLCPARGCWPLLWNWVCIHLLECSQQNLEPNPRLPDLTALTHVTWETPRELHCGTALVDCSGHQCWAASRQQPLSSIHKSFTSKTHLWWQILQLKSQRQFLWNNTMKLFSAPVFSLSFHTCLLQNQPGG